MLKIKDILIISIVVLLTGCTSDEIATGDSRDDKGFDPVRTPVQFSVGLEGKALTRSGEVLLPDNRRFVCTMYYHSKTSDDDANDYDLTTSKIHTAWLEVSGGSGNVVYKNSGFSADGTSFYWQNRLKHAFIAIADNNHWETIQGIYPSDNDYTNEYDLRKGELTSIAGQPDPILALAIEKPTAATADGNRVTLNFQHQFSQIQVNVKNADGNNITSDQITKVELLGVSETGYFYTKLNANGTVTPPTASEVNIDNYTDDQLSVNKWGTSFEMFDMGATTSPILKSYNAIAFGTLRAIQVTWSGGTATLEVQQTLASGKMYTYNLSIQRPAAGTRGLLDDKSQPSELVLDGDVSITNWPVKNR